VHIVERFDLPADYTARAYRGPEDHSAMAEILTAFRLDRGEHELVTAAHIDANYEAVSNCDLSTDAFIVEYDGLPVGYGRTMVAEVNDGVDGLVFAPTLPAHNNEPLFTALIDGIEAHLVAKLAPHHRSGNAVRWRTDAEHPGPGRAATGEAARFEARGYDARQWGATMVRPNLDDIPERSLPDGVELRPVAEDQLRGIVAAYLECFRGDDWGFTEPTESDYAWIIDDPNRDHTLWQVAWVGDQVVGQVKPFINHEENEARGYLRGYTEYIGTHRDWRNRGIAGTLLAWSLQALKDRGMTEAALGVDTNNPGGALSLYQSMGFEIENFGAIYYRDIPASYFDAG
jgi:ribosomal protein S18 acetylase RimI-like enzyme